jgi:Zn-finger nucleic acid-binding protein
MGGSEPLCPACGQVLKTANLAGVSVRLCPQCRGTLLAQIDMIRTLEAMSSEMLKSFDPDEHLDPVPYQRGAIACPVCAGAMTKDNYCSAGLVFFDRCEACRLLWLGTEELGTMTLMWARMERRLERIHKATEQMLDEADFFVRGRRISNRANAILFRLL